MCGIVSYIGNKQAAPILLDGLKKLEYRGYDSAGIAVSNKGTINLAREVGKVAALEEKIKNTTSDFTGTRGIAHTRWATHGVPSERNAHPHADCSENIYVAHNGIIENYRELKAQLEKSGHIFKSDTDTEVIAHAIEEEQKQHPGESLFEAVRAVLTTIKGTFGLAILSHNEPDTIIVAKNGSPLLIGVGAHGDEFFAASDASAVIRYTNRVVYLEDGEMAQLTPTEFSIHEIAGASGTTGAVGAHKQIARDPEKLDWSPDAIQKQGFAHFLLKEICEQPDVITDTMRGRVEPDEGIAHLGGLDQVKDRLATINRIIIISCGTARYAGLVGEYMLEEYAGIPVEVEYASEFRYRKPIIDANTACLFISQSGETADTIAALKEAKHKGALTLGIVNVVGSSIARMTDAGVYTHAGPEISVASTKAFVTQLTVLAILTLQFGRARDLSLVMGKRIASEINKIPSYIQEILDARDAIEQIAKKYASYENFLFLGRKYNFPIALEGALKLKELSYVHAEGYPTGEMKHGPIAMIDENFPSIFIAPQDSVYEKVMSGMEEIKARRGKVIAIATQGDTQIARIADDVIYIPKTLEMLTPLLTVIPLQLLSYYIATAKSLDIDKPRNLAKSVTVE